MNKKIINIITIYTFIVLALVGCKEKEKEPNTIGNGGTQINVESMEAPGGNVSESNVEVGKNRTDSAEITIDWETICVNDIECSDIEEMKNVLLDMELESISLNGENASRTTMEDVTKELKSIAEILEIELTIYN